MGQHGGGGQPGGGAQQVGNKQQGGNGGHQGGGGSGGGGGTPLLRFQPQVTGPVWATFIATISPLKDGKGTALCRDAVYKVGGCQTNGCNGWHPKRGSREAARVLDTVKAALPNSPFIAF